MHLLNQIDIIKNYNDKLIGAVAIILVGLCYKDEKFFMLKGLDHLEKLLNIVWIIQVFQNQEI